MIGEEAAWLILLVPLTPLLVALLAASHRTRGFLPLLSIAAPLPALAAALFFKSANALSAPWLLLEMRAGIDEVGRSFLLLFSLLWMVAAWHGFHYLRRSEHLARYNVCFLLAMAGNLGAAIMHDPVSFYSCFALMSFASYGLIVHEGHSEALRAGRLYIALVVLGELTLFSGLALMVTAVGTSFGGPGGPSAALLLIGIGFAIKAGLVPVHFWLPLAHPAAPVPASAVLSGAMIKVGLLGGIRFMPAAGSADAADILIGVGGITALYGVAAGILQRNPKALLAYSSISQMGLFTIGLGLAYQPGGTGLALAAVLLLALHHGFAKAALFLGTALAPGSHSGWPRALRLVGLALPAAALAGAPLTSGAVAKLALKSVAGGPLWLDAFLALSSTGTTVLLIQFLRLMWRKTGVESAGTLSPWAASIALSLSLMWVWPLAAGFLGYSMTGAALVASLWPVLLGTLLGYVLSLWTGSPASRSVPPGDILVLLERLSGPLGRLAAAQAPTLPALPAGFTDGLRSSGRRLRTLEAGSQRWGAGALATAILAVLLFMSLTL